MLTSKRKGGNAGCCLREGMESRNKWRWRRVHRASTRANRSRRVEFRCKILRRNGRKIPEELVEINRRNRIRFTYELLSMHFDVPVPKWAILPKDKAPILRSYLRFLTSSRSGKRAIDINDCRPDGVFEEGSHPQIQLFGKPSDNTAYHEFMHYLVYCTKNHLRATPRERSEQGLIVHRYIQGMRYESRALVPKQCPKNTRIQATLEKWT